MQRLNVVFMGTPEFAAVALDEILKAGHHVIAVYTQPPRPAGRGQGERESAVHRAARAQSISIRCPANLSSASEAEGFRALDPDVAVVVAYGLMVPKTMLDVPKFGCINIHASLLPRWRGAAPIERAILEGDKETGVTIMRMEEGLDSGPILAQRAIPIERDTDAGTLHDRLARLGGTLVVETLAKLPSGMTATPQPTTGVTYAKKISKNEARLDWHKDALSLEREIRAFRPKPSAFAIVMGERIKVLAAEIVPDAKGEPGEVLDDQLCVACGSGGLRLTRLQRPGKAPMSGTELLRGFPIPRGTRLE